MNLISLLQNRQELLTFEPLVSYLQKIEELNADIIFQNEKLCYLKDNEHYYKIEYRLSDGPLLSDIVEIGITDINFFAVRHTAFSIMNPDNNLYIPNMPEKSIGDEFLVSNDSSCNIIDRLYSYENNNVELLSSVSMELSLSEMKEIFEPSNFLDVDSLLILNNAKKSGDKVTELRIMVDTGARGNAFTRLRFGPLRYRFVSEASEDKTFIYTLKSKL